MRLTIARAIARRGAVDGKPANPILTHVISTRRRDRERLGHADLVDDGRELVDVRSRSGHRRPVSNLGRETFIRPVSWRWAGLCRCPGAGVVNCRIVPAGRCESLGHRFRSEHFDSASLPFHCLPFARDIAPSAFRTPRWLRLPARAETFAERVRFVPSREGGSSTRAGAFSLFDFSPQNRESAASRYPERKTTSTGSRSPDDGASEDVAWRGRSGAGGPDETVAMFR
jgi:hypothetical protein